jgi:hypothetical protein
MQDVSVARLYRVQKYRLPSAPSFKYNVLRESLSVDSQTIPCAILKRRGSWVISVYLCSQTCILYILTSIKVSGLIIMVDVRVAKVTF